MMIYSYTIWGRPGCVWCERAKELIASKGLDYKYIELTPENLEEFNERTNGAKTVPQIFGFTGERIGGYDQLVHDFE
jgi:glutaredoxin